MNVYINKHILDNSCSIMVLVAANSEKEAWDVLISHEDAEYYSTVFDDYNFILLPGVSADTTEPKILEQTGYINVVC